MNPYQITFKSSAAKEFRKLPLSIKQRLQDAINQLANNPRPSGVVKLKGDISLFRIRVGEYRVVYQINDIDRKLCVTRVRHRRDVYKD
jgi:mRNA interferase RelE/StbE